MYALIDEIPIKKKKKKKEKKKEKKKQNNKKNKKRNQTSRKERKHEAPGPNNQTAKLKLCAIKPMREA